MNASNSLGFMFPVYVSEATNTPSSLSSKGMLVCASVPKLRMSIDTLSAVVKAPSSGVVIAIGPTSDPNPPDN